MDQYEKATALAPQKATYPMYQQAVSYGFVNRLEKKIEMLNALIAQFPTSGLIDDSHYELALSYAKAKNTAQAIAQYEYIIANFPKSPYHSKALLNKGLLLYNNEQIAAAETTLKQLVNAYPNEAIAQQALQTVKEIAIEQNTVDAFSQWLQESPIVSIPDLQLEKAAFDAIERLLIDGKKKALEKALKSYIATYPEGGNNLRASFLLAELAFENQEWENAIVYYAPIAEAAINEYTEQSLVRMTQALINLEQPQKAFPIWQRLEANAQFDENKRYAIFNLMRYHYDTQQYQAAIDYALKIIALPNVEEQVIWDAQYIRAKAAETIGDQANALSAFTALEKAPQGERAVEALYFAAQRQYDQKEFAASNQIIEKIAQNYGGYPEWGAKSLLLMSKNFYQLDDAFQASFILESILTNFTQFPLIVKEAEADLANIKKIEAENNASINLDSTENE